MDANWETYLREAGLRIDSHMRFQDEKIAGLLAETGMLREEIAGLEAEIEELKNPPTSVAYLVNDSLESPPTEGPYHLDSPEGAFSQLYFTTLPGRFATKVLIRKDQPLRGSNKRCKSEYGPRNSPDVETYRRFPHGEQLFFAFDLYVPPTWVRFPHKVPIWSFRSNSAEAKVALRLVGDRLYLFHPSRLDQNPAAWQVPINDIKGRWLRLAFDMIFSARSQEARTRLYVDGKMVFQDYSANGYADGDLYCKGGLYVPAWSEPERTNQVPPALPEEMWIGMARLRIGDSRTKIEDYLT